MSGSNKFLVPGAIVVAALLIAGAVYIADRGSDSNNPNPSDNGGNVEIRPVTSEDHILGNPNAPIKIVEYSDIDCPFCADFHQTMNQIVDEYGQDGQVAWVFRHFPLTQLHPEARVKAAATECVATLSDNGTFWNYLDRLFERTDETRADLALIAREFGINTNAFNECLDNNDDIQDRISRDEADARQSGAQGTPHSIIVIEETGENIPLQGAQPYAAVSQIIETLLLPSSQNSLPQETNEDVGTTSTTQ